MKIFFVYFNSSLVITKYVLFFFIPLYIWDPILIILVFNSEPLPNALPCRKDNTTIFKIADTVVIYNSLWPDTTLSSLHLSTLNPHNSPMKWTSYYR